MVHLFPALAINTKTVIQYTCRQTRTESEMCWANCRRLKRLLFQENKTQTSRGLGMSTLERIKKFFLPEFTLRYILRIMLVALTAFLVFKYVAAPFRIRGASMAPTYPSRGFTFGCRQTWLLSKPQRGDVVIIRFAGRNVAVLKRIVAFPGETVEFRDGTLYVDGTPLPEPYAKKESDWDLAPRVVDPGHYYVVGDNRSGSMQNHLFGQVNKDRIIGQPIW